VASVPSVVNPLWVVASLGSIVKLSMLRELSPLTFLEIFS
jgi:hypothetical protein